MRHKIYFKIRELCILALNGKLYIEDFFKLWPSGAMDDFLRIVYEDVEDAVEHIPGLPGSKEVNWNVWKKTNTYKNLLIDKELLGLDNIEPEKLIKYREKCRSLQDINEENAKAKIAGIKATL